MNEHVLLQELKNGDPGALREIIALYTPYLCAIASNIMDPPLSEADVEEAVSDAFVRLWLHRDEPSPGKLKGWLAAVVRNRAKDALRAARLSEPLDDDLLDIAAPDDVEEKLLREELTGLAREAVNSLGEPDREIFQRRYFLYQKTEEIADALNMNAATVRTKLRRGREKLQRYLTERGYCCADSHF